VRNLILVCVFSVLVFLKNVVIIRKFISDNQVNAFMKQLSKEKKSHEYLDIEVK